MSAEIDNQRIRTDRILQDRDPGLVAIVGPCANHHTKQIVEEGRRLASLASDDLVTVHRIPMWKPRTPVAGGPKPWEGLHDTEPATALRRTRLETKLSIPVAAEIGRREHIAAYASHLSFAWLGARSLEDDNLTQDLSYSVALARTPIGVKNGLDGELDGALDRIERINKLKSGWSQSGSKALLLFRGGSNFQNPQSWEDQYKRALEATEGRMIVDTAHGSEMAHDPERSFKKTIPGQIACMERVISLAHDGFVPKGIMIEASDFESPHPARRTDPNMPFDVALSGVVELHSIISHERLEALSA